jgi:hypothetical protein
MAGYRKKSHLTCKGTNICSNMQSLLASTHTHSPTAQNLELCRSFVVNDTYRYSNVHLFPQNVQTGSRAHPASSSTRIGGAFLGR